MSKKSQKRIMMDDYEKYSNSKIDIVIAQFSELTGTPLDYVKAKYVTSSDKGKFVEDTKFINKGLQAGTHKFDKTHNFIKVKTHD